MSKVIRRAFLGSVAVLLAACATPYAPYQSSRGGYSEIQVSPEIYRVRVKKPWWRFQGSAPTTDTDASIHIGDDACSFFTVTTPVAQQVGAAVPTDLATSITAITAIRLALNNLGLTTVV